tara:strand:+ start:1042 stop:2052 length:1011 start_codon:yes stop_codon:yes gene_type:complete
MKLFKKIIIAFVLSTCLYVNYLNFSSSMGMPFLIADFNEGKYQFSLDKAFSLNTNFPNLSGPTQPMKMLVARYYANIDSIQKAKDLLYGAIEDNPYIKSPEAQLAYIFYDQEELDSAYYYAKNAFYGLPNNNVHRDIFFNVLAKRKDTVELNKAFNILRNYNENRNHWLDYFDTAIQILGPNNPEILNRIDLFEEKYPAYDKNFINGLRIVAKSDLQDLSFGQAFANLAEQFYENEEYFDAAEHYELAIRYATEETAYYENAAIAFYLSDNFEKAIEYFDIVINKFKVKSGKSEFYKGILLIESGELTSGCEYLKKSVEMSFADGSSLDVYKNFCN